MTIAPGSPERFSFFARAIISPFLLQEGFLLKANLLGLL